jgi:hypothetical protein
MVKIIKMPTEIRERLVVVNKKFEDELYIFFNQQDEITLTDSDDPYNPNGFLYSMNKEDWQEIKSFIDKYFE